MRETVTLLAVFALTLITIVPIGIQIVKAQTTLEGQGFPLASGVNILSPTNSTYDKDMPKLNVTLRCLVGLPKIYRIEVTYSVNGESNSTLPTTTVFVPVQATATYENGTTANVTSMFGSYHLISGCAALPRLPEGSNAIAVYAKYERISDENTNWPPVILDNETVCFTVNYGIPPSISNLSIENRTYDQNNLVLNFTANKPISWTGYSLDGKVNVTITGNTTLSDIAEGAHNITVYAKDSVGNEGASETVYFNIALKPELTPSLEAQTPTSSPEPPSNNFNRTDGAGLANLAIVAIVVVIAVLTMVALKKKRQ